MCYYNGQRISRSEFIRLLKLTKATKDYDFLNVGVHNGFGYKPCAVLVANEDQTDFEIVQMEWGYVPGYITNRDEANKFRRMYTTLNFKGENLFSNEQGKKSMWADAARNRRCLVLSTGIVESRHIPKIGAKGQVLKETEKFPYMVGIKEREYFWFPGLYNPWLDKETGELVNTFALGVTVANDLMKQIHNSKKRMPAILNDAQAWEWLMGNPTDERLQDLALTQVPSKAMEFCTIEKDYMRTQEATPREYAGLAPIDLTFLDTEELVYA
jgi:putative SOS response-associated peptidase YedK